MEVLLGTGNRQLVESCPNDRNWGIEFYTEHALDNVDKWEDNKLGKTLMKVKDQLRYM